MSAQVPDSTNADPPTGRATAFVDRDGTINRRAADSEYITRWADFDFLPGAVEGVRVLAEAGLWVVVVTNQRGIARGKMTEADLAGIHERMLEAMGDGVVDAIYHCPHDYGECDCRKPGTGMFERARSDLPGIDFARSVVIGDSPSDMQAGRALGSALVMLGDPRGEAVDFVAPDLMGAARWTIERFS